jgi:predicted TIM-barrel fold metal-dependent hydrolase
MHDFTMETPLSRAFPTYRRDFLRHGAAGLVGATLLAIHSGTRSEDRNAGKDKEPNNYVDAHVHVWTKDLVQYPLARGFTTLEMKPATFLPDEILRHAKPSGVTRVVLVQMSYYGFDNSYMLDVIRQSPKVFKGIAVVDWKGATPDVTMRELAKKGVRGFRIYPREASAATWLDEEGFDRMFRCGAERRLALCPFINPAALPALERQCRKFPETPVIIDHFARIGMGGLIKESDVQTLCSLSQYPQVKVKLSGFYALGKGKPPHVDLVPLIKRVHEAFGPRRLMWGSDCPFQVVNETYEDSIALIRDRLDFVSAEDKKWMLGRTADEFFFN